MSPQNDKQIQSRSFEFNTGFIIRHPSTLLAPLLCLLLLHGPLTHVHFIPKHHEGEVLRVLDVSVVHKLLLPVGEVLKALGIIYAEGEQAAVGATVERCPQAAKPLLTSRVPNLKRDRAAVHLQVFVEELHADGVEERFMSELFPTPPSPRRITFRRDDREDMLTDP
ncbi:hypothetical protein DNTS_004631 [Danionella cerebrum]|uniref:Uncharacterized protein n=1 Tax=Danionella cerebrum TaxID=2873325 RepID=A0A553RD07_9TELE|nr:hypothetical protein DNTS_004631 [Danionella translucida]